MRNFVHFALSFLFHFSDERLPDPERKNAKREKEHRRQIEQENQRSLKWSEMVKAPKKHFGHAAKHREGVRNYIHHFLLCTVDNLKPLEE